MVLLTWQVVQVVAALPLVAMPIYVQARESLEEPLRPPTLGTVAIVMMCGIYFAVAGLINGIAVAKLLGWHWAIALLAGVLAGAAGAVVASMLLYTMASVGGRGLTFAGTAMIIAMFVVNLMAPRWVGNVIQDQRMTILPN